MILKIRRYIYIVTIIWLLISIGCYIVGCFYDKKEQNALRITMQQEVAQRGQEAAMKDIETLNEDIIGWLKIPGTNIDYPLLQTKDNEYYLYHSFNKTLSKAGSIYMDYRNDKSFKDDNTIIYGHNMRSGSMFSELKKFKEQTFINQNNIIYVNQNDDNLIYEIFAVYITEPDFDYRQVNYTDAEVLQEFLNKVKALSIVQTTTMITAEDKLLTLSTCEGEGKRLVVHAKRIC